MKNMFAFIVGVTVIFGIGYCTESLAGGYERNQYQDHYQKQQSKSYSSSESVSDAASTANAMNEGNTLQSTHEASAPDIVFIPNNNTVPCHKVFGLSFSNTSGGGGIGIPYRDKACDYDKAASAADAQGNYDLGWYWRCHKKNIYKTFKGKGDSSEDAIEYCKTKMSGAVGTAETIDDLIEQIAFLEGEREIERKNAKDTLLRERQECKESTDRAHEACAKK